MEAVILIILVCVVVAAVAGLLVTMHQKNQLKTQLAVVNTQLENETRQLEQERADSQSLIQAIKEECAQEKLRVKEEMERQIADAKDEKDKHYAKVLDMQRDGFKEMIDKATAEVKSTTTEVLKERQKEFAESSNINIGQIVNPLKETIEKMNQVMNESTKEQTAMSSALQENIKTMIQHSEAAKDTANELIRAFKHESKVQGDWGEVVLNELLDSQGLVRGVHYEVQYTMRDEFGKTIKSEDKAKKRPDVILHLDQKRDVVIDSKVSLTAYMNYVNAENKAESDKYLAEHIQSIQNHVKELSKQEYQKFIKPPKASVGYVIMFVPHSAALWTALKEEPGLWRDAMEQNVYIADEQTLYAALRIVKMMWTQIKQAEKQQELYDIAQGLIGRVGLFLERFKKIAVAIDKVHDAYNEGEKSLNGNQSIIKSCEQMLKLGASQDKKHPLPQGLIDVDDIPAIEVQAVLLDGSPVETGKANGERPIDEDTE